MLFNCVRGARYDCGESVRIGFLVKMPCLSCMLRDDDDEEAGEESVTSDDIDDDSAGDDFGADDDSQPPLVGDSRKNYNSF